MKTKLIILFVFLSMVIGNMLGQNWNKISKDIKKAQILKYPEAERSINHFYKLRKRSSCMDKLFPIKENDTIFILDRFVAFDPLDLFSTHWNGTTQVSIKSDDGGENFSFVEGYPFTKYMMKLVSEWNIEEIKKEEIRNRVLSSETIYATRIIFNGKKYEIDCFFFQYFYNLKRDGQDFKE